MASGRTLICADAAVIGGRNWRGFCVHIPPSIKGLAMVKGSIISVQSVFDRSSAMQLPTSSVALRSRPRTAKSHRAAMNGLIDAQLHFWLGAGRRSERSRQRTHFHSTRTSTCCSGSAGIAHDAAPVAQKLARSAAFRFHRLQEGSPSSFARRDRLFGRWF